MAQVDTQPILEKAAADQQRLGQTASINEVDLRHAIDAADTNAEHDRGARFDYTRRALDVRNSYHRLLEVHAAPVVAQHVESDPVLPVALEMPRVHCVERGSARSRVELGLQYDIAG